MCHCSGRVQRPDRQSSSVSQSFDSLKQTQRNKQNRPPVRKSAIEEAQQEQPVEVRGDGQGLPHDDFRIEVEYDSDRGVIWFGHKKSKQRWHKAPHLDYTDTLLAALRHKVFTWLLLCILRKASLKTPRVSSGFAESVTLAKDGDDFVLDVDVNLTLESELILESRYRFPLRRVSVSDAQLDDLRTQLQGALDEI